MDIIIMAGGRGSRLGGLKKPFLSICERRAIDVAIDVALRLKDRGEVYVCLKMEDVGKLEEREGVKIVECPGSGYVEDLSLMLKRVTFPSLVLPADMPFLTCDIVKRFLDLASNEAADVVTLVKVRGESREETGISIFRKEGGSWKNVYMEEEKELIDIDTPEELKRAMKICASMEEMRGQR
ncbi:MAG TPA: hypothetical protein ENO36_04030 [Fervidicoccus fontis]|uniref:MobA-like NTP transferase domain-containing protein n=1 Tax=Fervidicoccus fontis TaxID=683846 RepID=A0A7C2UKI3_9CREN|nr:MAG: hypothetical protein C0179_03340 [Fervidicoccus sp.]HEU98006.1 hypothetical protein [Fervidicoccus fontis]